MASVVGLTVLTLVAFAANSVLCRMALAPSYIDPVAFTSLRLGSGALVLFPLARLVHEGRASGRAPRFGSWRSAWALFTYAMAFSWAYVSLETGTGALILFAAVQTTMILAALWSGERPSLVQWLGLLTAMGGLLYLVLPGLTAPDPFGALLMFASGVGWGVYSLRGRRDTAPVLQTAGNFLRTVPMAALALMLARAELHTTLLGVLLALVSGALTSGLGYVLWYMLLPKLSVTRAAVVQLGVPVLAALGGVVFLGEPFTRRLALSGLLILGGVALAILARARAPASPRSWR